MKGELFDGTDRKQKLTNIIAHVRPGPSRPRSAYDKLCEWLKGVWAKVIFDQKEKLDIIFIMGDIVAGYEQGFMLPEAGTMGSGSRRIWRSLRGGLKVEI
jgi:hypothetical protein